MDYATPAAVTPDRQANPEQPTAADPTISHSGPARQPRAPAATATKIHPCNQLYIDFLKLFREDACFDSAHRLFHNIAPRNEKHFCPFAEFFFGKLTSVPVLQRVRVEHCDFLVKYCGASSLSDWNTIVLDSLLISCSMVFQPSSSISSLLGVSKLLFVTWQPGSEAFAAGLFQ